MKVACIGGGPAGLYLGILLKRADPAHEVVVYERNRADDPFGFGVVFSDATGHNLAEADPPTFAAMEHHFARWDDIDVHYRGEVLTSTGHGFSGLSRRALLQILTDRCAELGVDVRFECEAPEASALARAGVDLVVAADGANSATRARFAEAFEPSIDLRPNRFVWLGTTRPFPAFTFYFRNDAHGLWRVHAYQYKNGHSTFIVETTEQTWRAAGMDRASEAETIAFCEKLFEEELDGHRLIGNRSVWRQFGTVRNERWHHRIPVMGAGAGAGDVAPVMGAGAGAGVAGPAAGAGGTAAGAGGTGAGAGGAGAGAGAGASRAGNADDAEGAGDAEDAGGCPLVLIGDAAHTAHFSIGSGTKLAMEDTIALAESLAATPSDVSAALERYEAERRPTVESTQRAAQVSLQWFEDTERYMETDPLRFAFNLLTRSLRVTHDNLKVRDPAFVARVDAWFAGEAERQSGVPVPRDPAPPPLFTPFKVRDLLLSNRVVVSPMCQYSSEDGMPNDWHLVHLGSRAIGGAGLVMAEMTDVSAEARITPACAGLYRPEHAHAWRRITDFVHTRSEAKIGVQLGHAGRKSATTLPWEEGYDEPLPEGAWPIVSASPLPYFPHSQIPQAMTRAAMERTLDDYVRAAHLAEDAGFDWLEIHFAHGYLLASFVSPLTNVRTDAYGGALENRMRYPLEVFDAARAVWPDHKPMSVRISAVDWKPGGMDSEEAVEIARMLKAHGCDVVDVSAGQTVWDQEPEYGRLFQTPFSDRIRHEAGIPTMAVGNISSFTDVNTILAAGRADLCMLARAHLWDPYWTRHAAHEMGWPLPWPPQYAVLDRYNPRFI